MQPVLPVGEAEFEEPPARRQRRPLLGWIGLATSAVAVLVVLAWLIGPDAPEDAPLPREPGAEPLAMSVPAAVESRADPLLQAVRVRLRVPEGLEEARKDSIVAALSAGGIADVLVEPLSIEVGSSRVGFYLPEDRDAAEALAEFMAPLVVPGRDLPVRDYGALTDEPEAGRLDLWIGR